MKKIILAFSTAAAVMTAAANAETPAWNRGVPPALAADNPYIGSCRSFAAREIALQQQNKPSGLLYRTWGVLADQGGPLFGNQALREKLLGEFDAVMREREKKPSGYWTILEDCEVFNLWRLYGNLPKEQLAAWQTRLRPSFEAAYRSINDPAQWMSQAANTLFQTALSLEFGALLFESLDPADADAPRWRAQSRKNIAKALAIQLPGGAFSYIRTSGPSPVYFNFDTAHLGRYYQLTGDPQAREALAKMAEWGSAATRCGWLTPFSAPWWKHLYGTGGPYTGFEHVAALSDDPAAIHLMEQRRRYKQPYVWTYGSMYAWKNRPLPPAPSRDRCGFDRNANGPALRVGYYDVEMPFTAWGDSSFGVSVCNDDAVTSYLDAIYVAVPGKIPRQGHMSYIMIGPDDVKKHAGTVGKQWIAGAAEFFAHRGVYGNPPPASSPFRRTELWYADADGAAGRVALTVELPGNYPGVELWLRGGKADKMGKNRVDYRDFSVEIAGAEIGELFADQGGVYSGFVGAGKRAYRQGECFAAEISVRLPGKPVLTAHPQPQRADGLIAVEIRKDGRFQARLIYNPTDRPIGGVAAWQMTVEEK